jgi:hypothetical protein
MTRTCRTSPLHRTRWSEPLWPLFKGKELSKGCRTIWSALLPAGRRFAVRSAAYAQAEAVGEGLEVPRREITPRERAWLPRRFPLTMEAPP